MTPIFPKLTEREQEVLDLVIQGYSNKEICEKLVIAPTTLKCHLAILYQKHNLSKEGYGYSEMRLQLALNYLKRIITDIKSQNIGLKEQNRGLQEALGLQKANAQAIITRLENEKEELKNERTADLIKQIETLKAENKKYLNLLEPFWGDFYFKGLDTKIIAELAKKSIRLTEENRRFEDCLQELLKFCNAFDGSNPDVKEILRLVKYKIERR